MELRQALVRASGAGTRSTAGSGSSWCSSSLGFAVLLGRAAWLQAVQAGSLGEPRREAAPRRRSSCPRRAGRSSTAPASSSRSASRRRRSTPTRGRCAIPRAVATAAARILGVDANALYEQLCEPEGELRLRRSGRPIPRRPRALEKRNLAGLGFYPEERRFYPQGAVASHVLGYAGLDNQGLAGLELRARQDARRQAGRRDDRRSIALGHVHRRRRGTRRSATGRDVFLDDRPHDPGERRGGAAPDGRARGTRRARPRSCSTRAPATCSRWRTRPGFDANNFGSTPPRRHAQPRGDRRLRARLDVQARHRRGRALRPARHARDDVRRCRTRSTSPTA